MIPNIPLSKIINQVQHSLDEDMGHGDISAALVPNDAIHTAKLLVREEAVLCGCSWFEQAFLALDPKLEITWFSEDGDRLAKDQVICEMTGNTQAILSAERTAINFLQTLSGTATTTDHYVKALNHAKIRILDTRKTIPGLRSAQKYAVQCGGGYNHRHGLYDGLLIKENHIMGAGSISKAVEKARSILTHGLKIEVEVETLAEVEEALLAQADILLLDNMSLSMVDDVIAMNKESAYPAKLEISGNMSIERLNDYSDVEIDYISIGSLTKNIQSIDFSLRIVS